MKLRFLFILLATYLSVSAQDEVGKLPDYTPPSPEASAMTKYADLQADEFNGRVSYSLPLYTYKAGKLELPISVSYNGAGVKVDDIPTWVGINWTLSAGGVITRSVRDKTDEKATIRSIWAHDSIPSYYDHAADGTVKADQLQDIVYGSQYDSEVDLFQFSFAGYSGSFFFDQNWNAQQLKKENELKIEVDGDFASNHKITITTPDGITYFFGGSNAIESTRRLYDSGPSLSVGPNEGVTAFYLTEIMHPVYGRIFFEYETIPGEINIDTQRLKKMRQLYYTDGMGENVLCAGADGPSPACTNLPDVSTRFFTTSVVTKINGAKFLKRIYNSSTPEVIHFDSESVSSPNFKRRLNSISVEKDSLSTDLYKTVHFDYSGQSDARFFLAKVTFDKDAADAPNTSDGRRNQVFKFDYAGSLPVRFSFSQDYLGYYNGKNNATSIPKSNFFDPTDSYNLADRKPDFSYAQSGSLTDIYYPTGGRTHFDYCAKKGKDKIYTSQHLHAYRNIAIYTNPDQLTDAVPPIPEIGQTPEIISVNEEQDVEIHVQMTINGFMPIFQRDFATLRVITQSGTTTTSVDIPIEFYAYENSNQVTTAYSTTVNRIFIRQLSPGKTYRFELIVHDDTLTNNPHPLEAKASFKYWSDFEIVDDCGVYLMRQTDYAADGQPENIKRYYYAPIDNLTPSVESLPWVGEGLYVKTDLELYNYICAPTECYSATPLMEYFGVYRYLNSDVVNTATTPNIATFPVVSISYGGDDFENGGIERTFGYTPDYGEVLIDVTAANNVYTYYRLIMESSMPINISNPNPTNGRLLKEKTYRKMPAGLQKVAETTNTYTNSTNARVLNVVSKKMFEVITIAPNTTIGNTISNYSVGYYLQEALTSQMTSRQNSTYIDPVPLTATDESSYRKITVTEDYEYASFTGQPTKITKNTSDNGVTVETRNYYVDTGLDSVLINPVIPNDAYYGQMKEKNIVSAPIETRVYKNSNLLSRQRTLYDQIITNQGQAYVPKLIQTAKAGEALEDRVEITVYDTKGNPLQVQQPSGAIVRYQYNARNQVTLKIENFPIGGWAPSNSYAADTQGTETTGCEAQQAYPNAMVTRYYYKSNGELWRITDPKCQNTTFKYNSLHQLIEVRDHKEKITKTFDQNFDRY
ncbi:hypothetical protein HUK80_13330 [Flavobacterium sp. MAH-1]|uniref:YD repeat-containing protein n=1 Tax=Flavobacterium agri TaxID=2743471 RepID=A0A7Y8Y3F1_9FLAO|nr:hypothetical protein [Flavobacterium agri]NUY81880.1 hypothetical protein [Flavobacterium agri]NYA71904.1 hypothetical protein [Flavobacterium agri]